MTTYAAWDDTALQHTLRSYDLFVNVHKGCEFQHAPVTWRHAVVLNAGKLIISERSYPQDEKEYEGLVTFVDRANIPKEYLRLLSRREHWRTDATRAHEGFAQRFDPERLFRRAGIYRALNDAMQPTIKTAFVDRTKRRATWHGRDAEV